MTGKRHSLNKATVSTGSFTTTGPAYEFDGANDYIDIPAVIANGSYSVSFWGFKNTDKIADQYVLDARAGGGAGYIFFDDSNNDNNLQASSGTIYTNGTATNPEIPEKVWQHYVVTGITLEVASNIYIGRYNASVASIFDGQISGMKIWNRILTANEAEQLFSRERSIYGV